MSTFKFKHFSISQANSTMKVGTDAMLLGSIVSWKNEPRTILDIGTGTGVLGLMLAQRTKCTQISAIEIDEAACSEAELNFQNSSWSDRLSAIHNDILTIDFSSKFDLIISNPPYYENSLVSESERTSRAKHAEFLPAELLVKKVAEMLHSHGVFWVIVPAENRELWIAHARENGFHLQKSVCIIGKLRQGEKRRILSFGFDEVKIVFSESVVRDADGNYSAEYIKLTKEFHDRDLSN